MLTSTCFDIRSQIQPGTRAQFFNGMAMFGTGPSGARYFPKLGHGPVRRDLPAEQWWTETIFILDPDTWVSRRDVVLAAANKEAAHVDANLTPMYERLIRGGDLGVLVDVHGNETPLTDHHYIALRQMGHELLDGPSLLAVR